MDTEKNVLMKCEKCGNLEEVPLWILEEMHDGIEPKDCYSMDCFNCGRNNSMKVVKKGKKQ
jgi:uncharacterized Zn finger protein